MYSQNYSLSEKFARRSQQEEDWGLLENWSEIQLWSGWQKILREMGVAYQGDRLLWCKDADPYQMKLVKARIRSRQRQRKQAK